MQLCRTVICVLSFVAALPVTAQTVADKSIAAIDAAKSDWDVAQEIAQQAGPVTVDVLTWLRLRAGEGTFAEIQSFAAHRPDWPGLRQLWAASEPLIDAAVAPEAVVAWFDAEKPQTGEGAVALAKAYEALDQPDKAREALREAWINWRLTEEGQQAMLDAFGETLAPFHAARADALLWRSRTEDAARLLPLLPPDQRALTAARIGYGTRANDLPALVNAVPAPLRDDPGLAYARYAWLAGRGEWTDAVKMLRARSTSRAAMGEPFRWSGWRRILARWEMREGRAEQAYLLASRHYLTEGSSFADLEWLSGYISLTYLGNPTQALAHFQTALQASSGPISLGRMNYWIGRAHEIMGNAGSAAEAFGAAAAYQTSFYGLLASERLGRPLDPTLAGVQINWQGAPVFANETVQAALILLAGGERGAAVTYFAALGRTLNAQELTQLGAYLSSIDEQYYTLLLGKIAVTRGMLIPELYYPVHDLAGLDLPAEPTLSLSIARRESEFNETIGSPVGALGLMQVMPGTAKDMAAVVGVPYARGRLVNDWQYNATLGTAYLAYLQDEFGPSPVMIAAGYNAGPRRPMQWMAERGDPRLREMDIVDWIEHIPFRETRNYVMRVTESIPVYEARLTGRTGAVQFTRLLIGQKPVIRPIARPETATATSTRSGPALRPVARP